MNSDTLLPSSSVSAPQANALGDAVKKRPSASSLGQFSNLFAFTLRDYVRSPWIFLNLLAIVATHALFYQYSNLGQDHFFAVEYAVAGLLAAITSGVIFSRANRAETYAILARPVPYYIYTGAMLACAWVLAYLSHLLSSLVIVLRFGTPLSPGGDLLYWLRMVTDPNGSLALAVAVLFAVALIALLSPFVSTSGVRLTVLAVVAIMVMSFDNRNFPVEGLRPLMQALPPVLAPLAGALKFATQVPPDNVATMSLIVLAAYDAILLALVLVFSTGRELILD